MFCIFYYVFLVSKELCLTHHLKYADSFYLNVKNRYLISLTKETTCRFTILFNPNQDGSFRGFSRMREGQKGSPLPKIFFTQDEAL